MNEQTTEDSATRVSRAVECIAAIARQRGHVLSVHDRATVDFSLNVLKDSRPDVALIVASVLAAGPEAQAELRGADTCNEFVLTQQSGGTMIRRRWYADSETAGLLEPLTREGHLRRTR